MPIEPPPANDRVRRFKRATVLVLLLFLAGCAVQIAGVVVYGRQTLGMKVLLFCGVAIHLVAATIFLTALHRSPKGPAAG
jgi:hypothetical protein